MAIPDNRIRFPSTTIDFDADVGVASQDHDTFPAPGQQARYDWMRINLVGLLASQSSSDEPTQFRDGTPWFDLTTLEMKIRTGGAWRPLAEVIAVAATDAEAGDSTIFTLAEWYDSVQATLASSAPEITFSGSSSADSVTQIPIPTSLRSGLFSDSRPFVYKNGLLLDPRLTTLDPSAAPTTVQLNGSLDIDNGDTFTVLIKRISGSDFYVTEVAVP